MTAEETATITASSPSLSSLSMSSSSSSSMASPHVRLRKKHSLSRLRDLIGINTKQQTSITATPSSTSTTTTSTSTTTMGRRPERRSLQETMGCYNTSFPSNQSSHRRPSTEIVLHRSTSDRSSNGTRSIHEAFVEESQLLSSSLLPTEKTLIVDRCLLEQRFSSVSSSTLFSTLFEDEDFLHCVGNEAYEAFDKLAFTPWIELNGDNELVRAYSSEETIKERTMSYEMMRTMVGFARLTINVSQKQRVRTHYDAKDGKQRIFVETVTRNSGVVYSDHFCIPVNLLIEEIDNETTLVVRGAVHFERGCFLKNRIESEAWQGMKRYFDVVAKELQRRFSSEDVEVMESEERVSRASQTMITTTRPNFDSSASSVSSLWSLELGKEVLQLLAFALLNLTLYRITQLLMRIEEKL